MHDEDGFLAAIRQTPADDTARLVYADWLDEQDGGTFRLKAAFIRLDLRIANEPEVDCAALSVQLQHLATQLDPDWLVVISRPKLEGCKALLERNCPSLWSQLTPTHDPNARTCEACQQTVRYARSRDEVWDFARRGYCTAVTVALVRSPDDLMVLRQRPLGVVGIEREPLIDRLRLPRARDERCPDRRERIESEEAEPTDAWEPVWGPGAKPSLRPPRRRNGRRKNRNIQRENWEEAD